MSLNRSEFPILGSSCPHYWHGGSSVLSTSQTEGQSQLSDRFLHPFPHEEVASSLADSCSPAVINQATYTFRHSSISEEYHECKSTQTVVPYRTRKDKLFEAWRQNLQYTLSLNFHFASFLADGVTWLKKSPSTPLRSFQYDADYVPQASRRTAQQKSPHLGLMLGQIANYCPIISCNTHHQELCLCEFHLASDSFSLSVSVDWRPLL